MAPTDTPDDDTRPGTDHDYSGPSLLKRYARGRVAFFANRQLLTLAGGLLLFFTNGPLTGLAAIGIALLGEMLDCLILRQIPGWLRGGVAYDRLYALSTLTAAIQAATISVCVGLAWFGEPSHLAPLYPIAFLAGAAINAALAMPYQPAAAIARLLVYAGFAVFIYSYDALTGRSGGLILVMNAAGAVILAYVVFAFLSFANSGFRRTRRDTEALVEQSRALEHINSELRHQQREARRLSLVAKHANDSVILAGADGRIFWTNDAFTRITGYTCAEVTGRLPGEFLNGPDTDPDTIRQIAAALEAGHPFRGEIQNRTKDGRHIWIDTNLVPVLDDAGQIDMVIAIERDVTAARAHASELEQARRAAEDGARAKAEFLATMSHEIRTPMNGVIGMADLLCETALDTEQTEHANTIRGSAQALLTIINDVLDLSKMDAQKLELNPVEFDLHACLKDVVQLLRPQARDKHLTLDLDLLASLPIHVCADDGRLRQVLINLIGNALKFTETGGVTIRAEAQTEGERTLASIAVRDTGIGIPQDKLAHVFERFSQADAATTRRFGGTGLGLTISRMLVTAMGGDITVTSQPGKGSCFLLTLPVEVVDTTRPVAAVPVDGSDLRCLEGKRVLVAEDNRVNRLLIDKYLAPTPVTFSFAHDGRQAVTMTASERPDIVFMDMSMPVMNGIEATREIRTRPGPQPRIVALTANAFASDKQACLDAGMDGFLTKPLRKADLLACLVQQAALAPP